MAYKKYYKTIQKSNEKYQVIAHVYYQGTQRGFKHGCDEIDIMNNEGDVLYSKTFDKPITCNYLNRTWEQYDYQTVLRGAVDRISRELLGKNIDSECIIKKVL